METEIIAKLNSVDDTKVLPLSVNIQTNNNLKFWKTKLNTKWLIY